MNETIPEIQSDECTQNQQALKYTVAFLSIVCVVLSLLLWLEHSKLVSHEEKKSFDENFIETMITHQERAANEADRALTQSEHAELKEFAARIKDKSKENIEQMQEWRSAWFSLNNNSKLIGQKQK